MIMAPCHYWHQHTDKGWSIWTPVIESDIPIPERNYKNGNKQGKAVIPWADFRPGQSLFVPETVRSNALLNCAAKQNGWKHGIRFTLRKLVENGVEGTRVWRTK